MAMMEFTITVDPSPEKTVEVPIKIETHPGWRRQWGDGPYKKYTP